MTRTVLVLVAALFAIEPSAHATTPHPVKELVSSGRLERALSLNSVPLKGGPIVSYLDDALSISSRPHGRGHVLLKVVPGARPAEDEVRQAVIEALTMPTLQLLNEGEPPRAFIAVDKGVGSLEWTIAEAVKAAGFAPFVVRVTLKGKTAAMPASEELKAEDRAIAMDALRALGVSETEAAQPHPSPAPKLNKRTKGRVSYKPSMRQAQVEKVMSGAMDSFHRCYAKRLAKRPQLAGKLVAAFWINNEGATEGIRVLDDELKDTPLNGCLVEVVEGLSFDKPTGGGRVAVNYPLVFAPTP